MALRTLSLILFTALAARAVDFVCPMDKDVRTQAAGKCPRCGMKLVAGIPDPLEYPVDVTVTPRAFRAGDEVRLKFRVLDPKSRKPVSNFDVIHEKLFHLFLISRDLTYFAHEHPEIQPDGSFLFKTKLPIGGQYRLLADFYPTGGTPQLVAKTMIGQGSSSSAKLQADLTPKRDQNLAVSLRTEPEKPIAGQKTLMFFDLDPADGLEPYLGALGHMLAASPDLIDMIHAHPAFPDPGKTVQFNVIFPRPGVHRVWVQFQREGKVNTVAFNVPVSALE